MRSCARILCWLDWIALEMLPDHMLKATLITNYSLRMSAPQVASGAMSRVCQQSSGTDYLLCKYLSAINIFLTLDSWKPDNFQDHVCLRSVVLHDCLTSVKCFLAFWFFLFPNSCFNCSFSGNRISTTVRFVKKILSCGIKSTKVASFFEN